MTFQRSLSPCQVFAGKIDVVYVWVCHEVDHSIVLNSMYAFSVKVTTPLGEHHSIVMMVLKPYVSLRPIAMEKKCLLLWEGQLDPHA